MNAIMVIYPYRHEGLWVFDDAKTGLVREPFIAGADTIIDKAVERKEIRNANKGFRLIFSASTFPLYDFKFRWVREADGGNWYHSEDFQMEGWLCPALFKYFDKAPEDIYAKFEGKEGGDRRQKSGVSRGCLTGKGPTGKPCFAPRKTRSEKSEGHEETIKQFHS